MFAGSLFGIWKIQKEEIPIIFYIHDAEISMFSTQLYINVQLFTFIILLLLCSCSLNTM